MNDAELKILNGMIDESRKQLKFWETKMEEYSGGLFTAEMNEIMGNYTKWLHTKYTLLDFRCAIEIEEERTRALEGV